MFGFLKMGAELLRMPRNCGGTPLVFSKSLNETYRFSAFLDSKERSWRFFGGSIDTIRYLCGFHMKFVSF
jgi:hypothetical protein